MNKQRKTSIKTELDNLRAIKRSLRANPPTREALAKDLAAAKARIDAIHDAEQSDYEKMSEKQQCSTQGEIAEECIALLVMPWTTWTSWFLKAAWMRRWSLLILAMVWMM